MSKKEFTQAQIDALAFEIMKEFNSQNEGTTLEEAREMAKMELNEKANRRYEKSDTPRKQTERKKKEDPIKREIISTLAKNLTRIVIEGEEEDYFPSPIFIENPEKEISFQLMGESYSVTLTKHRPKK